MEAEALVYSEAKRLYEMGLAVHWIQKNSKAPVKGGWSGPVRDDWNTLSREYKKGYGLGVRLGEASRIVLENGKTGYLANIDIDIKSGKKHHRREAKKALFDLIPTLKKYAHIPTIKTGYGLRYVILTEKPLPSSNIARSKEEAIVLMPSAEINKKQLNALREKKITQKQLDEGYRVRPAWEVDFMSSGKQVVLPPSIHPETKKEYSWARDTIVLNAANVPYLKSKRLAGLSSIEKPSADLPTKKEFTPVEVDLFNSSLSDEWVDKIVSGDGVTDRSAECFSVCMVMLRAGYNEDQILSVLTDRDYYLGETAYDKTHANTRSRQKAARWIRKYSLTRALKETSRLKDFEVPPSETPLHATEEKATKALEKSSLKKHGDNWMLSLSRGPTKDGMPGKVKATVKNIIMILENAISPQIIKRDLFQNRDSYACPVPWNKDAAGKMITDDDIVFIAYWLETQYGLEASKDKIFDAVTLLADRNSYHPVREQLLSLPSWDGVERLDTWLQRNFGARGPDVYISEVFRKWMVASVTRIFKPGVKFDWMIVLQGKTGTGKTSFGDILFGEDYYTDGLPPLHDKDAAINLQGQRCIEFGELAQLNKTDLETVKTFVTRRIDKVRPAYGRLKLEIKRQCVFIATVDREQYLKDDAGNRRFMPIEIGQLNFEALESDKDQLWAEALFIYQNGLEPNLFLEGEAKDIASHIQASKMVDDESLFIKERIKNYFEKELEKPEEERFNMARFKLTELFHTVGCPLQNYPENHKIIQFTQKALKMLGAERRLSGGYGIWSIDEKIFKK